LSVVILLSALLLTQMGILSIMVGAAYWPVKGAAVAATAGIALALIGAWSAIGVCRRFAENRRQPRA
jgi:hypothetical protein